MYYLRTTMPTVVHTFSLEWSQYRNLAWCQECQERLANALYSIPGMIDYKVMESRVDGPRIDVTMTPRPEAPDLWKDQSVVGRAIQGVLDIRCTKYPY